MATQKFLSQLAKSTDVYPLFGAVGIAGAMGCGIMLHSMKAPEVMANPERRKAIIGTITEEQDASYWKSLRSMTWSSHRKIFPPYSDRVDEHGKKY